MTEAKKKMGNLGKTIDDSLIRTTKKGKEAGKTIAQAAIRKSAQGVASMAGAVGKGVEKQMRTYSAKVKKEIGIKEDMTAGQKTGAVVGKFVDLIGLGVSKLAEKMEERQSKRFATANELKMNDFDVLIGENLTTAVNIDRAILCKEFVQKLRSDKKVLPYQLKDMRQEILKDIIKSASVTFEELLDFLKSKEGAETKAEVDYLKKEIRIIKEKMEGIENGTEN